MKLPESLALDSLRVQMTTTTPAEDPYGQGCAALVAQGTTADPGVAGRLAELARSKDVVAVVCAGLRVTGTIAGTRPAADPPGVDVDLDVHEISYRRPRGPRITRAGRTGR